MSKKYFISDNIIYLSEKESFEYVNFKDFDKFNNEMKLKDILEFLQNKKTIFFSKPIENYLEVKTKIENLEKDKIKNPQDDDYEYLETTSSIQIIEQLIKVLKEYNLETIEKNILEIFEGKRKIDNSKKLNIEKEIELNNSELNKIKTELEKIENKELKLLEKEISQKEEEILKLEKKKEKLEPSSSFFSRGNKLKKIEKKIKELKNNIEDLEIEIKIVIEEIEIFKKRLKNGEYKHLNPLLVILTLGLIYWTKHSDIKHIIGKLTIEIAKKKEKILRLQKKISHLQRDFDFHNEKIKEENVKKYKTEEKSLSEKEEIEIEIKEIEKSLEKVNLEVEKKSLEVSSLEKQVSEREDALINLESLKEKLLESDSFKIETEIEITKEKIKQEIKDLEEIKDKLSSQNTILKGNLILNI